ncbi:hypothetical protein JVU11DRAFT_1355 [Chiua virens]|nr:hypothetical protein JVU11DRAFT_1355 [Chiua virens]
MNKNPFVPQPTFNPPQPPLPPGPPPAGPPPDYSAYWTAAAQHQVQQPSTAANPVAYNPQWSASQPQRPPPEQSALYANYGYGGQNMHWQQRQQPQPQPQPQHYQPVQPMAPPSLPQPQPQYTPYQASVGFQAYVPQAPQAIISPPTYPQAPQTMAPPQPYFPQQQPPPQQPQHSHGIHHTPPQHLPPAKRQRFDGPSVNHHHGQQRQHAPLPQPQFQPPPTPQNPMYGQNQSQQGANQVPLGGNNRGNMGGRGGSVSSGRGRGGSMGSNRGGLGGQRGGRGGGSFMNGSGGGRGGQQGSLRGHGSRGGFGNKQDFHNRRGGSFNAGHQQHHQGNAGSTGFRSRGQGHSTGRAGRQDGSNNQLGNRDTSSGSFTSSGKKDENRRTLTDFKIVGLEMPELGWTWGTLPSAVKVDGNDEVSSLVDSSHTVVKEESIRPSDPSSGERADAAHSREHTAPDAQGVANVKAEPPIGEQSSLSSPPPSRIRIYFHTPVSPDDSHPIPHNSSYTFGTFPMDSRKGKRKKLEDDDGDAEEDRGRPPPPRGSQMSDTASVDLDGMGRGSAAPSVAETASEGDWLMAAIAEDDGDAAEVEAGVRGEHAIDEDDNQLRVSHVEEPHAAVSESTIPGLSGDIVNGEFPTDECRYDGCFQVEGVHLTTGGFVQLTLTSEGTLADGHGADSSGDDCAAAVDRRNYNDMTAASNDPALVLSSTDAPKNAPGSSPKLPNGDVISTSEDVVQLTASGNMKPLDCEDGSEPVLNGRSSLVEPSRFASQSSSSLSSSFDVSSSRASAPPPATQSDMPVQDMEAADHARLLGAQAPISEGVADVASTPAVAKPLQSYPSFASTIIDDSTDNGLFSQDEEILAHASEPSLHPDEKAVHDLVHDNDQEHLPEPPASPTSNTLLSTSSGSTYGESSHQQVTTLPKKGKTPSANRLSMSYAAGSRRLVVDAEVVEYLRVYRAEGRIEVYMSLDKDDEECLRGVLVRIAPQLVYANTDIVQIEGLSEATKSYLPLSTVPEPCNADDTIPPFSKVSLPSKVHLIVHLDTDRPLSEPKWVKSGDVQEWLKSMFGRMFWVAGDAADGWEKKIEVADPDPAPTIWTVLEGWAVNSPVGVQTERQRFLKTHMTEVDNLLEILLRLVRGERATPFSQTAPAISAPSISGPLLTAFSQSSSHGAQQTHVSLAVLAMFYMTIEYAQKAGGESSKSEAEVRIGEIIRCLPSHLIYKSLDGIFKENTYDSDNTVFSPQGRLHQVEYALEAVKQGSAAVGLRSKTHAILLALKRSTGELASYQQKMFRIDDHVGIAIAGLTSDARVLSNFMRQQALNERMIFNRPMPVNRLVSAIADKAQTNTQEYGRRPYGVGFLVIGQDQTGPHLYEFSPSGNSYEYFAMSIGARSQSAKTYLEKHYESFADCTLEELIKHGLHALRETLQQDKELNTNNTSVGIIGPAGLHEKSTSPQGKFRIVEGDAVQLYLESMDVKAPADGTVPVPPAAPVEDVQMSG